MSYTVLLFISLCVIKNVFTEDRLCNIEHVKLEQYVQNLVEAKLEEKAASRDHELASLKERLRQAESRFSEQDSVITALSREILPESKSDSKRFLLGQIGSSIGFMACVSPPDLINLGDKHTILFDRVITNTGDAYHFHTGIFIAPVKGLYAFYLTAMSMPGKHQYLSFVKDGVVISYLYPDAYGSATSVETAGNQWVVELNQGSEVWIQTYQPGEIHGNCYTVFSGFLLSEME